MFFKCARYFFWYLFYWSQFTKQIFNFEAEHTRLWIDNSFLLFSEMSVTSTRCSPLKSSRLKPLKNLFMQGIFLFSATIILEFLMYEMKRTDKCAFRRWSALSWPTHLMYEGDNVAAQRIVNCHHSILDRRVRVLPGELPEIHHCCPTFQRYPV